MVASTVSSYIRIGLMESAASYPLLTQVLREEWGFKGQVFSDMTHHGNSAFDNRFYENINNRCIAGCNQQLDSKEYTGDILAKWDPNKGCPVYNGVESYTWWYAVRESAKATMYSAAKCGAINKDRAEEAYLTFEGTVHNRYVTSIGKDISIKVNVPEDIGDYNDIYIDEFTPLPEGLDFDGEVISGSCEQPVNKFIHVMVRFADQSVKGTSFELLVKAVGANADLDEYTDSKPEPGKKGCASDIVSIGALAGIIALAGVATIILAIDKKRRVSE